MSLELPYKSESRAAIRDHLNVDAAASELSRAELGACIERLASEQPPRYWTSTRRRRAVLDLLSQYHEMDLRRESRPTTCLRQTEIYYLRSAIQELAAGDEPDQEVTLHVDD